MKPLAAGCLILLAGCGSGGEAPVEARPFEDPGYTESGEYTLYYAANPTTDLPAEVLQAHGVAPSQRRILVSAALVRRDGAAAPRPERATVAVAVRTLIGEPVALQVREVYAAGTPSYVAEFDARDREPYLFEVTARAAGDALVTARFQREFWLE
jgi:hypothetical protein